MASLHNTPCAAGGQSATHERPWHVLHRRWNTQRARAGCAAARTPGMPAHVHTHGSEAIISCRRCIRCCNRGFRPAVAGEVRGSACGCTQGNSTRLLPTCCCVSAAAAGTGGAAPARDAALRIYCLLGRGAQEAGGMQHARCARSGNAAVWLACVRCVWPCA
jgi:hypothetical protein